MIYRLCDFHYTVRHHRSASSRFISQLRSSFVTASLSFILIAPLGAELISLEEMTGRWKGRAKAAASKRKWTEAAELLRKVELANEKDVESKHLHAFVLYQAKQYSAAAQKYHEVLLQDKNSFAAAYHLGRCLYEMKFHALATTAFERAATLKLKEKELWNPHVDGKPLNAVDEATAAADCARARCLLDWSEALGKLRRVKFPEEVKRHRSEADRILESLSMKQLPDSLGGRVAYYAALSAQQKGKQGDARKQFRLLVDSMPEHPLAPTASFAEARSWNEEDPLKALSLYRAFMGRFKESAIVADALIQTGVIYGRRKEFENAAKTYTECLERFPEHARIVQVHYQIGLSYLSAAKEKGNIKLYEMAAEKLIEFTKRDNGNPPFLGPALYHAGEAFLGSGQKESARSAFTKGIQRWPDSHWAKKSKEKLNSGVFEKPDE